MASSRMGERRHFKLRQPGKSRGRGLHPSGAQSLLEVAGKQVGRGIIRVPQTSHCWLTVHGTCILENKTEVKSVWLVSSLS